MLFHPAVVLFVIFSFVCLIRPLSVTVNIYVSACCWGSIDPSMLLRLLAATTRTIPRARIIRSTFNMSLLLLTAKDGSPAGRPRHVVCLYSVICDKELIAQQVVTRMINFHDRVITLLYLLLSFLLPGRPGDERCNVHVNKI